MSKNLYKDLVNSYRDLDKEFECKKENLKLHQRIAELEEQLKNAIVPKFKYHQVVYAPFSSTDYYEGIIDVFDYYQKRYLVFFGDDVGNEWCYESEIFATEEEAQENWKN